jgi:TPP-dependent pyruvate/acetoin dehydrogenase alpha subunit
MKGTPLKHMFVNLFMRRTSPDQGRRAPAHLGSAPLNVITPASTVAAQFAIGLGVALAYQLQKRSNVVVALSGEGSTSLESSDVTATASLDAALKETGDKGKAASPIG